MLYFNLSWHISDATVYASTTGAPPMADTTVAGGGGGGGGGTGTGGTMAPASNSNVTDAAVAATTQVCLRAL